MTALPPSGREAATVHGPPPVLAASNAGPAMTRVCPHCQAKLRLTAAAATVGKAVRCPKCQQTVPPPPGEGPADARRDPSPHPPAAANRKALSLLGGSSAVQNMTDTAPRSGAMGPPPSGALAAGTLTSVELTAGQRFGDFEILGLLGRGGMGLVYHARDTNLDREVALKVLHPQLTGDDEAVQRFLREAKAAARLEHPNVVAIYSAGRVGATCYLALQLVRGGSVLDLLRRQGPLPPARAIAIVRQAATGLAAAHRLGLIHRDIKPANLMLTEDGDVRVTDFGLAKAQAAGATTSITAAGGVVGTPQYMSPEQCQGLPVDARGDIYSLGVTLYALLAAATPFVGDNAPTILYKHVYEPVPDLRTVRGDLPAGCLRVVHRALAKRPDDRHQTAEELIADLDAIHLAEPASAFVAPALPGGANPVSGPITSLGLLVGSPAPLAASTASTSGRQAAMVVIGGLVATVVVLVFAVAWLSGVMHSGPVDADAPATASPLVWNAPPGSAANPNTQVSPPPVSLPVNPSAPLPPSKVQTPPVAKSPDKILKAKIGELLPQGSIWTATRAAQGHADVEAVREIIHTIDKILDEPNHPRRPRPNMLKFAGPEEVQRLTLWMRWDAMTFQLGNQPLLTKAIATADLLARVQRDFPPFSGARDGHEPPFGALREALTQTAEILSVSPHYPPPAGLPSSAYAHACPELDKLDGISRVPAELADPLYRLVHCGGHPGLLRVAGKPLVNDPKTGAVTLAPQVDATKHSHQGVYEIPVRAVADFDLRCVLELPRPESRLLILFRHDLQKILTGQKRIEARHSGPALSLQRGSATLGYVANGKPDGSPLVHVAIARLDRQQPVALRMVLHGPKLTLTAAEANGQPDPTATPVLEHTFAASDNVGVLYLVADREAVLLRDLRLAVFDPAR